MHPLTKTLLNYRDCIGNEEIEPMLHIFNFFQSRPTFYDRPLPVVLKLLWFLAFFSTPVALLSNEIFCR